MKALVYDIEIKKAIPDKNGRRDPNVQYCDGWHDHANMGVSCIGAYEYATDRYRVFCDDNKEEFFQAVADADLLVSFNGIAFDNQVIAKCWGGVLPGEKNYDLLVEIWTAAGLGPKFQYPSHVGYGLDDTCSRNFGTKKSGNGALAPIHWQQGKYGSVIDYCLNDVRLTKQLFDHVLESRAVISPKDGRELSLVHPYPAPADKLAVSL